MRKVEYFCDVCKKKLDLDEEKIYYTFAVAHRNGIMTKPDPNNIEACSISCIEEFIKTHISYKLKE